MKLESRLGDFLRSLFKVTGIPQATTDKSQLPNRKKLRVRVRRPGVRQRPSISTSVNAPLLRAEPPTMDWSSLELAALVAIGASSWTMVSGIFAAAVWELEASASPPPEGYGLFAVLDLWTQLPNIVPAALVLFTPAGWLPSHAGHLTGVLLALGLADAIWLSNAASLRTSSDSIGLIVGAAAGGLLGSTSMVAFFPFAASIGRSAGTSLTALSVGVGLCGLLAQLIAYGSHDGTAYGASTYFSALTAVQALGCIAFAFLILTPRGRGQTLAAADGFAATGAGATPACSPAFKATDTDVLAIEMGPRRDSGGGGGGCWVRDGAGGGDGVRRAAARWVFRHSRGARLAGVYALLGIGTSCFLEFAMP